MQKLMLPRRNDTGHGVEEKVGVAKRDAFHKTHPLEVAKRNPGLKSVILLRGLVQILVEVRPLVWY